MLTVIKAIKRIALLLILVGPVAAWTLVKPIRVIAPSLVGIFCHNTPVCVEDPTKQEAANDLYTEGTAFISKNISPLLDSSRVIFCSSEACASSFGLGARSAVTVGTFGTVIGPRAWKPYYVRHELIHHLQGQRMGVLRRLLAPSWFVEGMAYSLSQDPRKPLAEPWEGYRVRFDNWYGNIEKAQLWQRASEL